jgi:membrane-bound ClpP family serine protease
LVIASAITTFGAVGLISMTGFGLGGLASTIVALGFAGAIGVALFFGIVKFMYGSQSNSVFSLDDLIGFEAEVITPVPEKGLGEIAYMANGIRSTLAARSIEGGEVRRGAAVIIREIKGNVALVQQKLTLDEIVLDSVFENSQAAGGAGNADGSGNIGDTGDTGDFEEAENGKPRRNAGNKN